MTVKRTFTQAEIDKNGNSKLNVSSISASTKCYLILDDGNKMDEKLTSKVQKSVEVMEQITRVDPSSANKQDLEYFQQKLQRALDRVQRQ